MAWGLILALAGCSSCGDRNAVVPAQGSTGKKFARQVQGVPGIENFAKVAPGIFRGGQPDAAGLEYLKGQGIRTVVNLRSNHSEKTEVEALGMAAVEIPLQGDIFGSTPPTQEQLKQFFRVVLDPARQGVLVHCAHGKDRTGTMLALYRMEVEGWTADEAIEEMQAFGYHDIYKDLIAFVRGYKPRGFRK